MSSLDPYRLLGRSGQRGSATARLAVRALAAFIGLALLMASTSVAVFAVEAPVSTETNRRIVTEAFARWAAGGAGFFEEVLSENVVWRIAGSGPSAGELRGRAALIEKAVRPLTSRLATPIRPANVKIWADGDHVIAHWQGGATARDGLPYRNSYVWILRMQGGKAVEVTAFLDLAPYDDVLRRVPASNPSRPSDG